VHLKTIEKSKQLPLSFTFIYSLKVLKEEQNKLAKFRATNGIKDIGSEIVKGVTSASGETKVVVQKWSNNVA